MKSIAYVKTGGAVLLILVLLVPYASMNVVAGDGNWEMSHEIRVIDRDYAAGVCVGFGDVDGDGSGETVVCYDKYVEDEGFSPILAVYRIQGERIEELGRFYGFSMQIQPGFMVQGPYRIIVDDLDGDAKAEIFAHGIYDNETGMHVFSYSGGEIEHRASIIGVDADIYDIDGDGHKEIVTSRLGIYRYDAGSLEEISREESSGYRGSARYIRQGNFTGVAEFMEYDGSVSFYSYSPDSGTFRVDGAYDMGTYDMYMLDGIATGDFDGDGMDEVFLCDYHNNYILIDYCCGEFQALSSGLLGDNSFGSSMFASAGDFDGDSVDEISVTYSNYVYANVTRIFEWKNDEFQCTFTSGSYSGTGYFTEFGDFDNDQHIDLAISSMYDGYLRIFNYTGQMHVDENPPCIDIEGLDGRIINSASPTVVRFRVTDNYAVSKYTVYADGEPLGDGITEYDLGKLSDGNHSLRVVAQDPSGHTEEMSKSMTIDRTPPLFNNTLDVDVNQMENTSHVNISWSTSDALTGVDRYEICVDDGTWIYLGLKTQIEIEGIEAGNHTVRVRAYDGAGNMNQEVSTFYVPPLSSENNDTAMQWVNSSGFEAATIAAIVFIVAVAYIVRKRNQ